MVRDFKKRDLKICWEIKISEKKIREEKSKLRTEKSKKADADLTQGI